MFFKDNGILNNQDENQRLQTFDRINEVFNNELRISKINLLPNNHKMKLLKLSEVENLVNETLHDYSDDDKFQKLAQIENLMDVKPTYEQTVIDKKLKLNQLQRIFYPQLKILQVSDNEKSDNEKIHSFDKMNQIFASSQKKFIKNYDSQDKLQKIAQIENLVQQALKSNINEVIKDKMEQIEQILDLKPSRDSFNGIKTKMQKLLDVLSPTQKRESNVFNQTVEFKDNLENLVSQQSIQFSLNEESKIEKLQRYERINQLFGVNNVKKELTAQAKLQKLQEIELIHQNLQILSEDQAEPSSFNLEQIDAIKKILNDSNDIELIDSQEKKLFILENLKKFVYPKQITEKKEQLYKFQQIQKAFGITNPQNMGMRQFQNIEQIVLNDIQSPFKIDESETIDKIQTLMGINIKDSNNRPSLFKLVTILNTVDGINLEAISNSIQKQSPIKQNDDDSSDSSSDSNNDSDDDQNTQLQKLKSIANSDIIKQDSNQFDQRDRAQSEKLTQIKQQNQNLIRVDSQEYKNKSNLLQIVNKLKKVDTIVVEEPVEAKSVEQQQQQRKSSILKNRLQPQDQKLKAPLNNQVSMVSDQTDEIISQLKNNQKKLMHINTMQQQELEQEVIEQQQLKKYKQEIELEQNEDNLMGNLNRSDDSIKFDDLQNVIQGNLTNIHSAINLSFVKNLQRNQEQDNENNSNLAGNWIQKNQNAYQQPIAKEKSNQASPQTDIKKLTIKATSPKYSNDQIFSQIDENLQKQIFNQEAKQQYKKVKPYTANPYINISNIMDNMEQINDEQNDEQLQMDIEQFIQEKKKQNQSSEINDLDYLEKIYQEFEEIQQKQKKQNTIMNPKVINNYLDKEKQNKFNEQNYLDEQKQNCIDDQKLSYVKFYDEYNSQEKQNQPIQIKLNLLNNQYEERKISDDLLSAERDVEQKSVNFKEDSQYDMSPQDQRLLKRQQYFQQIEERLSQDRERQQQDGRSRLLKLYNVENSDDEIDLTENLNKQQSKITILQQNLDQNISKRIKNEDYTKASKDVDKHLEKMQFQLNQILNSPQKEHLLTFKVNDHEAQELAFGYRVKQKKNKSQERQKSSERQKEKSAERQVSKERILTRQEQKDIAKRNQIQKHDQNLVRYQPIAQVTDFSTNTVKPVYTYSQGGVSSNINMSPQKFRQLYPNNNNQRKFNSSLKSECEELMKHFPQQVVTLLQSTKENLQKQQKYKQLDDQLDLIAVNSMISQALVSQKKNQEAELLIQETIEMNDKLLVSHQKNPSLQAYKLKLQIQLAEVYKSKNKSLKQIKHLNEAYNAYLKLTPDELAKQEFEQIKLDHMVVPLSQSLLKEKKYDQALQHLKKLETYFNEQNEQVQSVQVLAQIAEIQQIQNDYSQVYKNCGRGIQFLEQISEQSERTQQIKASFYENLGKAQYKQNEFELALESQIKEYDIIIQLEGNESEKLIQIYFNMGNTLIKLNQFMEAEQQFLLANKIIKAQLGEKSLYLAQSYSQLGFIQNSINNNIDSLQYYELAFDVNKQQLGKNNSHFYKSLLQVISSALLMDLDTKANIFKSNMIDQLKSRNELQCLIFYYDLGKIYQNHKRFIEAIDIYQDCINIFKQLDQKISQTKRLQYLPMIFVNIAICYHQKEQFDKCLKNYKNALEINTKLNGQNDIMNADIYFGMALVYEELKRFDDVKAYKRKADKIIDITKLIQ